MKYDLHLQVEKLNSKCQLFYPYAVIHNMYLSKVSTFHAYFNILNFINVLSHVQFIFFILKYNGGEIHMA